MDDRNIVSSWGKGNPARAQLFLGLGWWPDNFCAVSQGKCKGAGSGIGAGVLVSVHMITNRNKTYTNKSKE
jgi:hypothetical protein